MAIRLVLAAATLLVTGSAVAGRYLTRHGTNLHMGSTYPVAGHYEPHLNGWLLPALVIAAAALVYGARLAAALPWWPLLAGSYPASIAWAVALGLVGGGPAALSAPLAGPHEYLVEVSRLDITPLREFSSHIDGGPAPWTTHVAGHPPLATLVFVWLARGGFTGPGWAAVLCVAVGALAVPAVLDTVRVVGDVDLARRAAPFVAFSPAALWVATSADAIFCGVAAVGLWAVARGVPLAGGLLLGAAIFLSYGLVLLAPLALAAAWLRAGRRLVPALVAVAVGVSAVVAAFAVAGFWWPEGLALTAQRVRAGAGWQDRPAVYFLVANPAALAVSLGPAVVAAFAVAHRAGRWVLLPAAAVLAVTVATLSQLSRGEVERIYLPFASWLSPLAGLLPARGWLAAHLGWAVLLAATTTLAW